MNEQMEREKCIFCKHFTVKIMLNGYNGICEKRGCFTRFKDHCDRWEERKKDNG